MHGLAVSLMDGTSRLAQGTTLTTKITPDQSYQGCFSQVWRRRGGRVPREHSGWRGAVRQLRLRLRHGATLVQGPLPEAHGRTPRRRIRHPENFGPPNEGTAGGSLKR